MATTSKRGFLRIYLYLALTFGILGILDNLLGLFRVDNLLTHGMIVLIILFYVFNIQAISFFHHHRVDDLAHALPYFYLITQSIIFIISLILVLTETTSSWIWNFLLIFGLMFSVAVIIISLILLRKFDFQIPLTVLSRTGSDVRRSFTSSFSPTKKLERKE
ncbi:hypothetical protein HOE37_04040 [Candidatus Woesearchaeota archaeon]|nr:hypothetical protein [Candidatus Woesearchaeota archaeon]MBT4111003.1 hypothetical protein [Candidatus Woesearchaeota archaeon]MBT4336872.1 hypothetical protein [Candidatus Woesearchaeota archaeon]MBT4469813.1 hypothetical protein [Candidatus Woesearchaeota archaeon]MBT6743716.1 hypothetical protein [Candidatus Woesearchaeota archaeon]